MTLDPFKDGLLTGRFGAPLLDIDHDGSLTLGDVWAGCKYIFFIPGDFAVAVVNGSPIGSSIGIASASAGGWASAVISLVVWICIFSVLTVRPIRGRR
jgi:hypothetical protein